MPQHLLNISDLSIEKMESIVSVANIIAGNISAFGDIAKGKILATLFYEPSTRTRLSFESAMMRLGGTVLGFSDMSASSAAKGETVEDTAVMVGCYADIMAVRHPIAFTPHNMAAVSSIPVINAGDGPNEHPTQTLTDLCTIYSRFGRLDHLTIGLCGDLKYGRTTHSLIKVLAQFPGNHFYLIAPLELRMPCEFLNFLKEVGAHYEITDNLANRMKKLDVLYMTRIQKERFDNIEQYEMLKGCYILDPEKMRLAKQDMIVMHPLPRVDEIDPAVDKDPRAWYFKQAQTGVYARMALLIELLGLQAKFEEVANEAVNQTCHITPMGF